MIWELDSFPGFHFIMTHISIRAGFSLSVPISPALFFHGQQSTILQNKTGVFCAVWTFWCDEAVTCLGLSFIIIQFFPPLMSTIVLEVHHVEDYVAFQLVYSHNISSSIQKGTNLAFQCIFCCRNIMLPNCVENHFVFRVLLFHLK